MQTVYLLLLLIFAHLFLYYSTTYLHHHTYLMVKNAQMKYVNFCSVLFIYFDCYCDYLIVKNAQIVYLLLLLKCTNEVNPSFAHFTICFEWYCAYLMVKNAQIVYLLLLLSFVHQFLYHSTTHPHNHAYLMLKNVQIVNLLFLLSIDHMFSWIWWLFNSQKCANSVPSPFAHICPSVFILFHYSFTSPCLFDGQKCTNSIPTPFAQCWPSSLSHLTT